MSFPSQCGFNDLYADIRMDQMQFYTWWQGLCSGSGSGLGEALGVSVTAHALIVECSAVQAAKAILTPTGARPPDGASAKAPLLPLSILRFPLAAEEVQGGSKSSSWSCLYF